MQAIAERNRKPARPLYDPLPLENGARLTARDFLRRYEAMPEVEDAEYLAVKPDARGLIRSRVFPGLVLDVNALLAMKSAIVLAVLRRGLASTAHETFTASLS